MPGLPFLLRRIRDDRQTQLLLTRYVAIGAFVFCVDIGTFQAFLRAGLILPAATSASFGIAIATHFTLNRFLNFRNFERTIVQQFGTYLVVAGLALLIQNGAVLGGVHLLGLPPLVAKIIGIAINVPLGFFGHRYLTFGRGILGTLRRDATMDSSR
jgi:putative flippase GtrA